MRQTHTIRLEPLQQAWLQELGVEVALLRPYVPSRASSPSPLPSLSLLPAHRPNPTPLHDVAKGAQRGRAATRQPVATVTAPPSTQSSIQPRRTPPLACQVYVTRVDAGPHTSSADWLIISETSAGGDARTLIPARAAQLLYAMLGTIDLQATDAIWRFSADPASASAHVGADRALTRQDLIKDRVTALQPACILALGRAAATALLQTTETLSSLRGKVWSYLDATGKRIPTVVTYPPGWLLANPQHKVDVWRDLLLARGAI